MSSPSSLFPAQSFPSSSFVRFLASSGGRDCVFHEYWFLGNYSLCQRANMRSLDESHFLLLHAVSRPTGLSIDLPFFMVPSDQCCVQTEIHILCLPTLAHARPLASKALWKSAFSCSTWLRFPLLQEPSGVVSCSLGNSSLFCIYFWRSCC